MRHRDLTDRLNESRLEMAGQYFEESTGSVSRRLESFARFVDRTSLSRFLVRYELFKLASKVQGSIVECGVYDGGGLFAFANFSALLEPLNHRRHVIGFDTFAGFPGVSRQDLEGRSRHAAEGGVRGVSAQELERGIELFDSDRALSQLPKIELVEGDFLETGERYLAQNPHLVVSLLYLDFDIFEPTLKALELFLPRMPAGAVLAFDEVHVAEWPGETQALLSAVNFPRLALQRFPVTSISYAVLRGDERNGQA